MTRSSRHNFLTLALGNLLGKGIAFFREVVFAQAFGTGPVAAGFRVAQTVSFVPANLVSNDILPGAFVPSYAREVRNDSDRAALLARSYALAVAVLVAIPTVLVVLYARLIVDTIVPGGAPEMKDQATAFLQILAWCIPAYGLSAIFALILVTHGRVGAQSLRPALQSVGLLAGTLLAITTGHIALLASGFVAAWVVYALMTGGICWSGGYFKTPQGFSFTVAGKFLLADGRRVLPLLPLPIIIQASILIERFFASLGDEELLASVDYARTVSDSVMSLIAVPLGVLGLTRLSGLRASDFRRVMLRAVNVTLLSVPLMGALIVVFAPDIISLIYERGAFDSAAVTVTSQVLMGQSVLLVAQVLGYFLVRATMAEGRNKIVLYATGFAVLGQVGVQALVLTPLGAAALGLGPSVNGLVLVVILSVALGIGREVLAGLVFSCVPLVLVVGLSVLAVLPSGLGAGGLIFAVWVVQLAVSRRWRNTLRQELFTPLRGWLRRNPGDAP